MRLLLIEDDDALRQGLARQLEAEGYRVDQAPDGAEGLFLAQEYPFDLAIVDLGLPKINGLTIVQRLRAAGRAIPLLILTARGSWQDKVAGLEAGADDYVVKPFAFAELLARVRGCLRRRECSGQTELRFSDLTMDLGTRDVSRGPRQIALTATEFELLRLFLQNPRLVLTRDRIYEGVWGYEFEGESKVIEVYISQLRQKLEANREPRLIHTIRGAGYALREEG